MREPGPDPDTTRPSSEGGWFRFTPELPGPDRPTEDPESFPATAVSGSTAIWNPIPSFLPTETESWTAGSGTGGSGTAGSGVTEAHPAAPLSSSPAPSSAAVGVPETGRGLLGSRPPLPGGWLPESTVEYPQLLRGPRRTWWRPVLTLVVFIALFASFSVLPFLAAMAYGLLTGVENIDLWLDDQLAEGSLMDPGGYLYLNLSLVVLIPAAMLSIWAVHRIRPRFLSSVAGGLRWRWLLRCLIVLAPLWAAYLTISTVTDPPQSSRPDQWLALLIIGLLLTPWQAAAEEYAFRGWITQNIGAYFARPLVAFVVPTVIAAAAFAAAHGSPDPWILADLAVFSVVASIMTWRTGGLEAAIVLHAVNNVGIDIVVNTIGGFEESMVGAETRGTPLSFAVSLLVQLLALALVLWQARRCGVDRWFRPPPSVGQEAGAPAVGPLPPPAGQS